MWGNENEVRHRCSLQRRRRGIYRHGPGVAWLLRVRGYGRGCDQGSKDRRLALALRGDEGRQESPGADRREAVQGAVPAAPSRRPAPQAGAGGETEGRLAQSVDPSKNRLTLAVLSGWRILGLLLTLSESE